MCLTAALHTVMLLMAIRPITEIPLAVCLAMEIPMAICLAAQIHTAARITITIPITGIHITIPTTMGIPITTEILITTGIPTAT